VNIFNKNKILNLKNFFIVFLGCFLYGTLNPIIPIPLPIPAGLGQVKDLKKKAAELLGHAEVSIAIFQIILIVLTIILIAWFTFFIIRFLKHKKVKKLIILLDRLDLELILRKSAKEVKDGLSLKETIYVITQTFKSKFFVRRVGGNYNKKIAVGLEAIEKNSLDLELQRGIVGSLIKMLKIL
jgi:hypothetical protein